MGSVRSVRQNNLNWQQHAIRRTSPCLSLDTKHDDQSDFRVIFPTTTTYGLSSHNRRRGEEISIYDIRVKSSLFFLVVPQTQTMVKPNDNGVFQGRKCLLSGKQWMKMLLVMNKKPVPTGEGDENWGGKKLFHQVRNLFKKNFIQLSSAFVCCVYLHSPEAGLRQSTLDTS